MPQAANADLVVRYSLVSLVAWIWLCVILIAASVGMVLTGDRGLGELATGIIVAPLAAANLVYLVSRLVRRVPRYVIAKAGFEDHRGFQRVSVPWSDVSGVTVGRRRHSRGRRCIVLSLREGSVVNGSWPWWMRGWAWETSEVRFSDWLVRVSLNDMESAIQARLAR